MTYAKGCPSQLRNLPVSSDGGSGAVAGASAGGLCASRYLRSHLYRSSFDMSGEAHPQLGGEERTISDGFLTALESSMKRMIPSNLMSHNRYEESAGIISWESDIAFKEGLIEVDHAAGEIGDEH